MREDPGDGVGDGADVNRIDENGAAKVLEQRTPEWEIRYYDRKARRHVFKDLHGIRLDVVPGRIDDGYADPRPIEETRDLGTRFPVVMLDALPSGERLEELQESRLADAADEQQPSANVRRDRLHRLYHLAAATLECDGSDVCAERGTHGVR